jgi:protocatechuate 3,4-dioxygenase beta subunit
MSLTSWLRSLRQSAQRFGARWRSCRPRVERLEDRTLPAVALFGPPTHFLLASQPPADIPHKAVVGHFNNDGNLDLAVIGGLDEVDVFLGDGHGGLGSAKSTTLLPISGGFPVVAVGLAAADFNADGNDDLVVVTREVTGAPGPVEVLLSQGDGTFQPFIVANALDGDLVAVGHFHDPHTPDFVVLSQDVGVVSVFVNQTAPLASTPSFAAPQTHDAGTNPSAIAVGDFNGDHLDDVAVANQFAQQVLVILNSGDGTGALTTTNAFAVPESPEALAVGDFDGNGTVDIAHAGRGGDMAVLHNDGSGTHFTGGAGVPIPEANALAAADFNGDGKDDLAAPNLQGQLTSGVTDYSVQVALGDVSPSSRVVNLDIGDTSGNNAPTAVAAGDFNNDGGPDLVVVSSGYNDPAPDAAIFLNQTRTRTQLQSSAASAPVGQPITFTATVSATVPSADLPTGSVNFYDGPTLIATAPVTTVQGQQQASFTVADLTVSPPDHQITAVYVSDDGFQGSRSAAVPVTITSNTGATHLGISAPGTVTAGSPFSITVTALDQNGNPEPGYRGTVSFTTSDTTAATVLPTSYTFLASDNGVHTFSNGATLVTGGFQTITAADTLNRSIAGSTQVEVLAATHFSINAPSTVTAGSPFSITVTALDQNGNPAPGYQGTVRFATTDSGAGAVLPPDYTFGATDGGVHTFPSAVILVTGSFQTLRAADTRNSSIAGSTQVEVLAATHFSISAPSSVTAGLPFSITVTALDQDGNPAPGYRGTVHFATTDGGVGVVLPPDYTFGATDGGVHTFPSTVILVKGSFQTLTAADTLISSIAGSTQVEVLAATHFSISAPSSVTAGVPFNITVTALDRNNNPAPGYRGTVHFATTDSGAGAVLPPDYTFGATDSGVHTFPSAVTLVSGPFQSITAVAGTGNASLIGGTTVNVLVPTSSLSGLVFEDFNDDGQVDFGEQGIAGVKITLTRTDSLDFPVNLVQQTGADGTYRFRNLLPGNYTITETQPAGYGQGIDSVGTAAGSLVATDQFLVHLGQGVDGLNYNFGERPPAGAAVHKGQTAGVGFWNSKEGQALIRALNGGTGHQLGDWLAASLPNIFGAGAGGSNLTGKSNAFVAALFQSDHMATGPKLDAQVLATALSVYVTSATLDPDHVAAGYGFTVQGDGVGTATVNVGSSGAAFGVGDNTMLTVMDLLLAANDQAVNGVLYPASSTRRKQANDVFSAANDAGNIG